MGDGNRSLHSINESQTNLQTVKNKKFYEVSSASIGSLTKVSQAILVSWCSPSIPRLMSTNLLNSSQGSWVCGSKQIGGCISTFIMATTIDIIGRKGGILLSTIPVFIGWILVANLTSFPGLFMGRFISGLGSGYGKIAIGTYIGEVAEPKFRGALGTLMAVFYLFGLLFTYATAPFLSTSTFAYICAAISFILFILFMWMPETPYFYLMHGKNEQARKELERIRGHTMVDKEYERILNSVRQKVRMDIALKLLFREKKNRQPFIIMCILFAIVQFTGKLPLITYCEYIFTSSESSVPAYWGTIITGLTQLVALLLSFFTIDRFGRRKLLIFSSFGVVVTLGCLTIYFYVKDKLEYNVRNYNWVPLTSLIGYNLVFSIGINNIPFILVSEIFSTDVKSVAVCLSSLILPLGSVINIKLFQILSDAYGRYVPFLFYTIVAFLSVIYCKFCVPETKNKTLEDIQNDFNK